MSSTAGRQPTLEDRVTRIARDFARAEETLRSAREVQSVARGAAPREREEPPATRPDDGVAAAMLVQMAYKEHNSLANRSRRGLEKAGENIREGLHTLKQDVREFTAAAGKDLRTLGATVKDRAGATREQLSDRVRTMSRAVRDFGRQVGEWAKATGATAAERYTSAKQSVRETASSAAKTVRREARMWTNDAKYVAAYAAVRGGEATAAARREASAVGRGVATRYRGSVDAAKAAPGRAAAGLGSMARGTGRRIAGSRVGQGATSALWRVRNASTALVAATDPKRLNAQLRDQQQLGSGRSDGGRGDVSTTTRTPTVVRGSTGTRPPLRGAAGQRNDQIDR